MHLIAAVTEGSARMGKTVRQIQGYIHSLRTRGLLLVIRRADGRGRQLANAYDLRPLLAALEEIATREVRMRGKTTHTRSRFGPCSPHNRPCR